MNEARGRFGNPAGDLFFLVRVTLPPPPRAHSSLRLVSYLSNRAEAAAAKSNAETADVRLELAKLQPGVEEAVAAHVKKYVRLFSSLSGGREGYCY